MSDPRFPIGKFEAPAAVDAAMRRRFVDQIAALPGELHAAVQGLDARQLGTPYRDGGWTVRQVVHHVADSHMNAYVRAKLAVTEAEPTVKTYDEAAWAELADAKDGDVAPSLTIVQCVHGRWVTCLRALPAAAFARKLRHPERGPMAVDTLLALYAWHGRHHVAHVTALRRAKGW